MTPEGQIKKDILNYLQMRGVFCWVNQAGMIPGRKLLKVGISDILGCYNGRLLAIEVKAGKAKPTPPQLEFIDDVNQSGGLAFVARCVADVVEKLI